MKEPRTLREPKILKTVEEKDSLIPLKPLKKVKIAAIEKEETSQVSGEEALRKRRRLLLQRLRHRGTVRFV